jgi:hypothetical protein
MSTQSSSDSRPTAAHAIGATLHAVRMPLFAYYLVTIAVPLANGAGNASRAFIEHIAFVLFLPPTLVGFFAAARHAFTRLAIRR